MTAFPAGLPDRMPRTMPELKRLARQLGVPKKQLLVLTEGNDPYNADTAAKHRDAAWFVELWQRFGYSHGVYLHRAHYRAQATGDVIMPSGKTYENTVEDEAVLIRAAIVARHLGRFDPLRIVDKRSDPTQLNIGTPQEPYQPPKPTWSIDFGFGDGMPWSPPSIGDFMVPRWAIVDLVHAGDIDSDNVGDIEVGGYEYSRRLQPFLNELWVEKDSMSDVLGPLCREQEVNYTPGDGFISHTRIIEMLRRAQRHDKPVRLFLISDFDPGGDSMPVALARNVEFYRDRYAPGVEFVIHHIGMTADWVEKYDLPRTPIKESDRRKDNFEARHGEGAVELDALEALHRGALAAEVNAVIEPFIDATLADRLDDAERQASAAASDVWQASTASITAELGEIRTVAEGIVAGFRDRANDLAREINDAIEAAVEPFRERWEALEAEFDDERAPLKERLTDAWSELQELADDEDLVELPDRPEPETGESDESDALFDSRRHWHDQLAHYHAAQGHAFEKPTRECVVCGEEFEPTGQAQKCCTTECRKQWTTERGRAKAAAKRPPKRCVICGVEFVPPRTTSKACPKHVAEVNARAKRDAYRRRQGTS